MVCPTCECKDGCGNKHSKRQFSLKTGTIYEGSPLGLDKWLTATWFVMNCKNRASSCAVARALNVKQKAAWFMDCRIRASIGMESSDERASHAEADETFVGRKARNIHAGMFD